MTYRLVRVEADMAVVVNGASHSTAFAGSVDINLHPA